MPYPVDRGQQGQGAAKGGKSKGQSGEGIARDSEGQQGEVRTRDRQVVQRQINSLFCLEPPLHLQLRSQLFGSMNAIYHLQLFGSMNATYHAWLHECDIPPSGTCLHKCNIPPSVTWLHKCNILPSGRARAMMAHRHLSCVPNMTAQVCKKKGEEKLRRHKAQSLTCLGVQKEPPSLMGMPHCTTLNHHVTSIHDCPVQGKIW